MDDNGSTLLTEGGGTPATDQNQQSTPAANNGAGNEAEPTQEQTWHSKLPEELRGNASLQKYKDETSLAKAYISLEQMLGSEKIPMPKGDDDKDGWDRVYKAVGRPDTPDKYDIEMPAVPDGMTVPYDQDEEKYWRDLAHQNGLSNKQFKNMFDSGVKARLEKAIAWQRETGEAKQKAIDALSRDWGQNFEANVGLAKTGLNQFADPDFKQYLEETGLGNHPAMTRFMYKVGRAMNGQTKIQGAPKATATTGDLDRQIMDYRAKHGDALSDKSHPSHDFHVKSLGRLYEQRYDTE